MVIARSVTDVQEFTIHTANQAIWESWVLESRQTSEGPFRTGTTGLRRMRVLARTFETEWRITEHVPGARTAFESTAGPFAYTGVWTYEADGDGTRFTYAVDFASGFGEFFRRLAEPLVAVVAQRQIEQSLRVLKNLLEA